MYENYKILLRSNISNRSFYLKKETKGETFLIIFYSPFTTFYTFFCKSCSEKVAVKKASHNWKKKFDFEKIFNDVFYSGLCALFQEQGYLYESSIIWLVKKNYH